MRKRKLRQTQLLGLILCIAMALKLPHLYEQTVAFDFDHGRDALAVMHMLKLGKLKFIGPWTSISGLFFGPLYYYLLAPLAWLTNGHPLSQVWTMFILVMVQAWLVYRYFGFWEAIILVTAPAWSFLALGSSNAFPMTLVTWLILIILKPVLKTNKISTKQMFWLGICLSLGFHFSSALAIFFLLAIPLILLINRVKPEIKTVILGLVGFGLVFLPQVLFEIKHNFIEIKAIAEYIKHGEKHRLSLNKINYIAKQVKHELALASLPEVKTTLMGEILVGLGLVWMLIKRIKFKYWREFGLLLVVPIIGFSGLHYNPWYAYGLFPIAVLMVSQVIKNSPQIIKVLFLSLLLIASIYRLVSFYDQSKAIHQTERVFYKTKMRTIDYIYRQTESKSFAVYTYVPEIYDYAYQYLFFWQGFKGRALPVEFSYKPGEISYVKEKPDLLSLLPEQKLDPEKVFLILGLPENKHHYPLDGWLDQFKIDEVINKTMISDQVWVWEVRLKTEI